MMKRSAVQAFRSITDKIHPQVGLTSKESQRLLNALTTSFRQQLDSPNGSPTFTHSQRATLLPISSTAAHHLSSVLTNPLLAKSVRDHGHRASTSIQTHPVKSFEDAVSQGAADIHAVRHCLELFRTQLSSLPAVEAHHEIRNMDAGARVVRWLASSGLRTEDMFRDDYRAFMHLTYFLVAEERQDAIWDLMSELPNSTISLHDKHGETRNANPRALLLRATVASHLAAGSNGNAESALEAFFDADQAFGSLAQPSTAARHFVKQPALYLSRKLCSLPVEALPSSDRYSALFDRFIRFLPFWQNLGLASLSTATLMLRHPRKPTADYALQIIRGSAQGTAYPLAILSNTTALRFCFDAVHLMQKQGLYDDAAWTMEFMQRNFENDLLGEERTSHHRSSNEPVQVPEQHHENRSAMSDWRFAGFG